VNQWNALSSWDEKLSMWPAPLPTFQLKPERTALLIIDMQQYFCDKERGISAILAQKSPEMARTFLETVHHQVIPNIQQILRHFREHKLRTIHITVGPFLEDGSDLMARRRQRDETRRSQGGMPGYCHVGAEMHGIIEALAPAPGELVLNKNSTSAFNSTALDQILRNMGIDMLVCCGLITNGCVDLTARDAADKGYHVALIEDACASYEPLLHATTLRGFARMFGRVCPTGSLLDELNG